MKLFKISPSILQIQLLIWLSASLLIFFSIMPMDGYLKSILYTLVNISFYALVIYGNILFLYPLYYQRGRHLLYIFLVILFVIVTGLLRGYATILLYNFFLPGKPRSISFTYLIYYIPAGILIFILSLIFRVAIAYFKLKRQNEEILVQKSQAELNFLKAQVQPHFLFNTLNNIYFEAFKEAPRTAELIDRLSDIMRYFVDETPKDTITLNTEVSFIENYITLEKIRIRHGVDINFEKSFDSDLRIPPMLLMTFVENIFKHGINRSGGHNLIQISLVQQASYLIFKTSNSIHRITVKQQSNSFGIANLKKRLTMLYGSNFDLVIDKNEKSFTALLKIPLT